MSNITTRAGKGSPLTNNELDANFTNLNSDKVEIGGDLSGTSSAPNVAKIQGRAVSTDAPAAGEKLVWNGTAWEPSVDPTGEPIGHADKTQSTISFNSGTRTFTIAPVASEFVVWCKGVKYTYTSAQTVVIPNTTGLHYIYFSSSGVLSTQMSYFSWADHAPTAYVYWNATTSTAVYFGDERHGVVLDWQTHEYLHRTRGAAIANGFLASGYTLNNSATDAATQIAIESGTFFDEDMKIDIVSTATPTAGTYQQNLLFPAKIPVLHLQGTSWVMDAPTDFPFRQGTSRPQYNSFSGGVWSTEDVGNNQHATTWILATNNLTYPVIAIIGQSATDNLGEAEAFSFADLTLTGFPSVEFRPLYKLIYKASNGYENSVNAQLVSIIDLRSISAVGSVANPATDHGNLSGLSDDDHAQYLHVSEVRSPSAAVKNSFLPSQTSNSGKYLSTDGTNPSWVAIPSGSLDFTGDVTGTGTTGSPVALTLANSGVTAGTYSKVTVDGKGRVTVGTNIASGDVTTALGFTPENAANKGVANGYAGLDSSGKIASSHLPSYVDDVLEYANLAAFPATGDSGKIYIAIDSAKVYRWSGSAYVEISASPGSTDAVPEGSTNLYHTTSRVRTSISASGSLSYNNTTGTFSYTTPNSDGITEGSTNLYFTNARARSAVSATGSLSYNSSTGVFSYTQPTNVSTFTNDSGYLTGITGAQVTTALGYTPYNSTNPAGYTTNVGTVTSVSGTGTVSGLTLTGSVTSSGSLTLGGTLTLTSGQVTTALGYTPYNSTNPAGYTTNVGTVTSVSGTGTVSGLTLTGSVTSSGSLVLGGTLTLTSGQVTTALGYTPYNSTNPSGYITSSSLSSYLPLSGGTLTGTLYFTDSTNGISKAGGRLTIRSEATDDVANFASYGLYLPRGGQTAGLYVQSPIEARGGLRMGDAAGNGTITVGADTAATANRLVQRDSGGDIYGRYFFGVHFNQSSSNTENPSIAAFWTNSGSDNYCRKSSPAHVISQLGLLTTSGGTVTGHTNFNVGVTVNSASPDGYGINLYTGSGYRPIYGLYFGQTGTFGTYGAVSADWATYFTMNSTADRGWIFREAESLGNVAAISNQGNMTIRSHFEQGNNIARPNVSWGAGGTSTGMVIFYLPGTTANYGMVHMVFDIYEYNGNAVSTVIVGGHNWSTSWYNTSANVIGSCAKSVRLGFKDNRFCVVFGGAGSSWEYGTIVLRKIHNASFYDNVMNMVGDWSATQTTTESFTNITGDLRALRTPAQMEVSGILYGYNSVRSNIFYDTDNTGYYSDPQGSSRLNVINCGDVYNDLGGWFRNYGATGIYNQSYGNHFYSDSGNYWNVSLGGNSNGGIRIRDGHAGTVRGYFYADTSNNVGFLNQNGSWRARVVGGDYFLVEGSSARAPIFYDSENTTYYIDPNAGTSLNAAGNLSYGNGGSNTGSFIYHGGGSGDYGVIRFYQAGSNNQTIHAFPTTWQGGSLQSTAAGSINLSGANGVTFGSWNAVNAWIDTSGNFQSNGSSRAPIFYDSNDTGYYLDPHSTSRLNYAVPNRIKCVNNVNNEPRWDFSAYVVEAQHWYGNNSSQTMYLGESNYINIRNTADIHGDTRSPIYYDRNDTGYYIDPNSTSDSALRMRGGALFGPNTSWSQYLYVGTNGRPSSDASVCATDGNLHLDCKNGSLLYLNYYSGRPTICGGDLRSNIYYDLDNTGYYVDGASTSTLNYLLTRRIKFIGEGGDSGVGTESYAIYQEGGGWSWPYPDLRIAFHTGIKLGANSSYQGIRFYTDYDMSSQVMSVNNGSDPLGGGNVYVNSALQAGGSLRAPIFYDSNDTTYYTDPAATTALRTVGDWRANSHDWSGEFSGKMQYHAGHWYIQSSSLFIFRNAGGANVMQCDSSGNVTFSGNVTAYSDRRLKSNVVTLDSAAKYLSVIDAKRFTWNADGRADIGFIAQDVEEAGLPEFVLETGGYDPNTETHGETVKSLDYGRMVAVLWQAVKEQQSQIEAAVAEIKSLKERLQ